MFFILMQYFNNFNFINNERTSLEKNYHRLTSALDLAIHGAALPRRGERPQPLNVDLDHVGAEHSSHSTGYFLAPADLLVPAILASLAYPLQQLSARFHPKHIVFWYQWVIPADDCFPCAIRVLRKGHWVQR